eukprot:COSAG02_NODE_24352_length_690_cov_13.499154_1_plen_58_part_01
MDLRRVKNLSGAHYKLVSFVIQLNQDNKAIKAYPRAHMHRDSDLRVGMSAAPGYSGHM